MEELDRIVITGARQHNLKHVTVEIPKKKLVVLTGVSGSGKSSLAFDTLYAEGQRRYIESLNAYARQFLGQMDKPLYDSIRGLAPTISIEQKAASSNPRSTVGTVTEIHDYLRVLWARVGKLTCHECGKAVTQQSSQQIVSEIQRLPKGTRFMVLAPLLRERKGEHRDVLEQARKSGFTRVRIDGVPVALEDDVRLDKKKKHTIDVVVDRLIAKPKIKQRLHDSVETALRHGQGIVIVAPEGKPEKVMSQHRACHDCGLSFPEPTPQLFSFNSPQGMCPDCSGLGTRMEMDPGLVVPNPGLSINEGAVKPLGAVGEGTGWGTDVVRAVARERGIDLNCSWSQLPTPHKKVILYGTGSSRVKVAMRGSWGSGAFRLRYEGAINSLMRRMRETRSEDMRQYYQRFLSNRPCSACEGQRIRPEALGVKLGKRNIAEITGLSVSTAYDFFDKLALRGNDARIAVELLKEIRSRLRFLLNVGLGYLTLERPAPSLSGGEGQRIRLASQIGSELTGVVYVLDEPSIGLHQRDNKKLLQALQHLRDIGNSVVVVEHDREAMEEADWLIDFGPGAGRAGGEIVAAGTPATVARSRHSLTGRYLRGAEDIELPSSRRSGDGRALSVRGARENNLKGVDADFPLGLFICVTGVSGAGKSTLVNQVLYPAVARALHNSDRRIGAHDAVEGTDLIDKVIDIDQSPIGRTPRSNPATYTKVFDLIRDFFAQLPESRMHGYKPGRFSFNVKGGRCESCEGDGVKRVEMHFLADVYVPCEVCHGKRFNDATLEVKYNHLSIADVLELTVDEASLLFKNHPQISRAMRTLADVGLGYIALGQSSPTLSGGEAQRVKLSRELAKRSTGRTLYILDEPTTGLHFDDIRKLLRVLDRLVDAGNTVVVIEHNLDVIKTGDHVIDLGPEGGDEGGYIVAAGTPEEVAQVRASHTGRFLSDLLPEPERAAGGALKLFPCRAGWARGVALAGTLGVAGCAPSAPHLIQWGWGEPSTKMLRERLGDIEATPFDGCVFHVEYRDGKRRGNLAWRAWGRQAIPAAAVEPALRDLRALRSRRLRHNFLRFNVTPGDVDWFDDFSSVLGNARLAARLAQEGGAVGIVLDTEQYEGQLFDYSRQRDVGSRSYDEYAAQVRRRGRELIQAFQSEYPDLTVLMTFSYSLPWRDVQRTGKPLAELSYGMLVPFVDGLVEGTENARLIDGYEMSYGYRSLREFEMAYARMSTNVLPMVADPTRYREVTSFAFGLWMDYDSGVHGWDPRNVGANYFSPPSFERSVRWALETTDRYVWIYTQDPRWWTENGGSRDLPPAYEEAIHRARKRAKPRR